MEYYDSLLIYKPFDLSLIVWANLSSITSITFEVISKSTLLTVNALWLEEVSN